MKSNAFVLMLDARKAFDRVNYCKLFRELLKREMSPLVLRLLLFMYTNQTLRVKWGSVMSESFTVMNGVKQGGVLSPVLFAVYTDGLLLRLQESGIGCHMGGHYAGALAYADDITLISPSMTGLRKMSSICEAIHRNACDKIHINTCSMLLSMIFCLMEVKVSYYFSKAVVVMYPLLVLLYAVS